MSDFLNQRIFSVVLITIFVVAVFLSFSLSQDNVGRAEVDSQPAVELIELPASGVEAVEEPQDSPKLMINTASASEIAEKLKGIGEKTAQLIVDRRDSDGIYQNFEELEAIRGIGPAKIEANRDIISFDLSQ